MKTHTTAFKNQIKEYGRELDSIITYTQNEDTIELGQEELNSISPSYEGSILKSVMRQLIIDSNVEIPIGTELSFEFGVKVSDEDVEDYRDNYDYVSFGNYIVKEVTKKEDTKSYEIKCYDKMLNAMQNYIMLQEYSLTSDTEFISNKNYYEYIDEYFITEDTEFNIDTIYYSYVDEEYVVYEGERTGNPHELGLYEYINQYELYEGVRTGNPSLLGLYESLYPIKIREYINKIADAIGLTFKNRNDTFVNYDKEVSEELFMSKEEEENRLPTYSAIGYTYRDILDQLAEVTASTICINEEDDELEIRYINDTNEEINDEYLKDNNVNFGELYGPINSIVISRAAESDSVYLRDDESVALNGLTEIKIKENQFMNFDDRETYLPDILEELNGLTYFINDFSSTGIVYLNLCDKYNIKRTIYDDETGNIISTNIYNCVLFNDEIQITQGLEENIHTDLPEETETDYDKADKTDQKINRAMLIVNKQENYINGLVRKVDEQNQKLNEVEVNIDSTSFTVNAIQKQINDGIENAKTLKNTMMEIDSLGIHVKTDDEPIETLITNKIFSIKENGEELAYFGYRDNETKAVINNLNVGTYFVTGVHRFEKVEFDNEERTGVFYIGG